MLCRGSVAIPLTDDHKAAREDETVRPAVSLPPCRCWVLCRQGRCGDRETCGVCVCLCCCRGSLLIICRASLPYDMGVGCGHEPDAPDVQARVEAAGGQILFWNGVRVMGVLAVSRAIGDHCLRPFVIAEPEVCAWQ